MGLRRHAWSLSGVEFVRRDDDRLVHHCYQDAWGLAVADNLGESLELALAGQRFSVIER